MKLMTIAATVSLTLALGCSRKGAGGPARVPVTVAHVEQRAVPFEIPATGTAEPVQTVSVQAQVTGVLTHATFHVRDDVSAWQVLFEIDPLLFRVVPEQHLAAIQRYHRNRLPVLVSPSKTDTVFTEGVLSFVDNSVDTTTGTVLLKGEFPNRDNALWPGEFLTVRLQLYVEDSAVVVPSQAVMNGQQGTYLFVVNQDGTARSQPVTVERTAGAYAVIAQGVRAGDEVVTDGQVRLVSGAAVEVKGVSEAARELGGDK